MTYEVELERDESGAWLASVPSVPGCHTYGRSLRQARNRIREALDLWVHDAGASGLSFRYRLASEARSELRKVQIARKRAAAVQRQARLATSHAVHRFGEEMGLSVRDIAELLGLSHQRVQQLLEEEPIDRSELPSARAAAE